jgi:hypothetical protein
VKRFEGIVDRKIFIFAILITLVWHFGEVRSEMTKYTANSSNCCGLYIL